MNRRPHRWPWALALGLLLPLSASALDPNKSVFQFNIHNWTRHEGLPGNKVNTVTQTADGYLWIGTQNGLVRFDGREFVAVPVDLPLAGGQDVKVLAADPTGGFWFAISEGGFGHFDGRAFAPIGDPRWNRAENRGRTLLVSRDGSLWTGSDLEVGRWVPGEPAKSMVDPAATRVISFCEDPSGRIWIGTENQSLHRWADGQLSPIEDPAFANHVITALAADRAGRIWMATEHGICRYDPATGEKWFSAARHPATSVLIDRQDVAWVGTAHGLVRVANNTVSILSKSDGLGSDYITSLFEDQEGSLWIGTQDGLSQLSDLKFPIFSAKEGLNEGGGLTVSASRRGGVWITTTAGIAHFDGRAFTHYNDPKLLPNPYVKLGLEARNGDFYWIDGERNISVLRDGRCIARHRSAEWTEALTEDDESVIAGIGSTLVRVTEAGLVPMAYKGGRAPDFQWLDNLWTARDGAIWVACYNGVFRVKNGEFRQWSTADGLSGNRVHFVFEDDDGCIWAGLSTGMARIRGNDLRNITEANGLFDNRTYAIVPDDVGYFWVNSGRGIYRVSRQALHDFANGLSPRVQCEPFDGEESVKFTDRIDQEYSGCRSADGRVWFPNPWGAVMIDPTNYTVNRVPPPVHIQRVEVNGTSVALSRDRPIELAAERVEFFFTALSFISPRRLQLRYQLEGFDPGWIEAGARRSAQYSLKPGRYVFRVQAANADGVWNNTGDTLALTLPPPFYATPWFYGLCGLSIAGGLFAGFRWKVRHIRAAERRLREENDRLEARIAGRTRELARSVALLHATLESVTDGILAVDRAGKIVSFNTKFADLWQLPAAELKGSDVSHLRRQVAHLVKDPAGFLQRAEELQRHPETPAFDTVEFSDGRLLERYVSPQLVEGRCVGFVVNWRDITARKRAEATIAEASRILESLLKHTLDFVYFKDRESRFVRYSDTMLRLFGLTAPDALKGRTDFDCFPAEHARAAFADEQEIVRTGQPMIDKLEQFTLPDGRLAWALATKMPWRDERGAIIGTFGVSRDITAIKLAEAELAYERDLLRGLMNSSPDKIYFKDLRSRFLRASRAQAESFRAKSEDEMLGKTDFDYFTPEHAQPAFDDEQRIIQTGQPLIGKVEKETWHDGRVTWALTSKMPLRNNAGEIIGTVGISKDITELKEAEAKLEQLHKQLLETSREAGMAEVATSVLHNVGNVLNSVNVSTALVIGKTRDSKVGNLARITELFRAHAGDLASFLTQDPKGQKLPAYLQLLSEQLATEQATIATELEHLRKNVEHIKDIVSMQQSYAKVCGVSEKVELVEIVEDALRINSGALSRHEVQVVRDYAARPVLILERHKVMQILVNLIRNAKYACDDSGRPDKQLTLRIEQAAGRVKIIVSDNGVGIPAENLTRIFAHGFTTRKEGHGFGLHSGSLAARELGGSLTAHSDGRGCGATFILELPDPAAPGQ